VTIAKIDRAAIDKLRVLSLRNHQLSPQLGGRPQIIIVAKGDPLTVGRGHPGIARGRTSGLASVADKSHAHVADQPD
jgi:hypothetical protein